MKHVKIETRFGLIDWYENDDLPNEDIAKIIKDTLYDEQINSNDITSITIDGRKVSSGDLA